MTEEIALEIAKDIQTLIDVITIASVGILTMLGGIGILISWKGE